VFYLLILLAVLIYGSGSAYVFLMCGYASKGKDMILVTLFAIFWPITVPWMLYFQSPPKGSKE
jgi:hypothetical protein